MDGISAEILQLLYSLLPGLVAAWVFYGLTAHPKASQFERIVQALIFTVVIGAIAVVVRTILLWIGGRVYSVGAWNTEVALVWSVLLAFVVGLLFARWANNNAIHEWLRCWQRYDHWRLTRPLRRLPLRRLRGAVERFARLGLVPQAILVRGADGAAQRRARAAARWDGWLRLYRGARSVRPFRWLPKWEWTCRTSFPSQWYSVFSQEKRYVVLHLRDERRLWGWPTEWPDQNDRGQFVVEQPIWLLNDGRTAPLLRVAKMVIDAADVQMVEFLKHEQEDPVSDTDLKRVQDLLIEARKKGADDGREIPTEATAGSNGKRRQERIGTIGE